MYAAWLADFAAREVAAIGFGIVTLHRPLTDREPVIDLQEVRGPVEAALGATVAAGIAARALLAEHTDDEILALPWRVGDDVTIERHYRPGEADPRAIQLRQGGGLRHTEVLGTEAAALLSVCDGELTAAAAITAIAAILGEPEHELRTALQPRPAPLGSPPASSTRDRRRRAVQGVIGVSLQPRRPAFW